MDIRSDGRSVLSFAKLKPITTPQEAALKRFTFPEPEELSPPIIRVENGVVGYDGKPVLSRLSLRIDGMSKAPKL